MKRLKKKILGILLSIVMVLGLMPGMSLMTDAANSVTETISTSDGVFHYNYTFQGSHCDIIAGFVDIDWGICLGLSGSEATFLADPGFVITEISFNNSAGNTGGVLTKTAGRVTQSGATYTISGINDDHVTLGTTGQLIFFSSVNVTLSEENTPGTDPAAAASVDIPVRVEGTPDGSTGHIELDQQIDVNDPNTFIDIMTGVGGFCIYLVPTDQAAAPDNITGSYEFVYGGTTYRGDFSATKKYDLSCGFYYVVLGGLGANNNSGSSSGHNHHKCEDGHKFSFLVLEAATTEKDGVGMWCCERCGIPDWNEHENAAPGEKVVISAYTVFNDTLENNIKAAESGATVSITTSRWISVRRGVLEALAEKPGVTLTVNFKYQGMGYVIAIPGGDPALAGILASEDRFFGLMNLGNTYGLTAVEK